MDGLRRRQRASGKSSSEEVIAQLQLELQEARAQAAQARLALDAEIQARRTLLLEHEPTRDERSAWQAWLRQEQSVLNRQRAELHQRVSNHADLARECELLRKECARRFPYLLLAEKQGQELAALSEELRQARQAWEHQSAQCERLEADLAAAYDVAAKCAQADQRRITALEAQLHEERQKADALKSDLNAARDLAMQRE